MVFKNVLKDKRAAMKFNKYVSEMSRVRRPDLLDWKTLGKGGEASGVIKHGEGYTCHGVSP